jgi:hypothetical protein
MARRWYHGGDSTVPLKIIATGILGLGLSAITIVPSAMPQQSYVPGPLPGQPPDQGPGRAPGQSPLPPADPTKPPPKTADDVYVLVVAIAANLTSEIKRVEAKIDSHVKEHSPSDGGTNKPRPRPPPPRRILHVHYYPCCVPCPPWW